MVIDILTGTAPNVPESPCLPPISAENCDPYVTEDACIAKFGTFGVTSFSDTFNRADETFYFGIDWYTILLPTSAATSGASISTCVNVAALKLVLGDGVSNFGSAFIIGIPRSMDGSKVKDVAQFAQMTLAAFGGTSIATGPAVFLEANGDNGYCARTQNNAGNRRVAICRNIGTASTIISSLYTAIVTDVVRIEVTPAVGSNTVRLYINGVLKETVVDSNAARPTGGMPGIAHLGSNASSDSWTTFSCGIL